jgi:hypothetical protein
LIHIVTTYATGIIPFVVFVRTSFGLLVPNAAGSIIPAIAARVHVKDVPAAGLNVGLNENTFPLQRLNGPVELVMTGVGLTVTTRLPAAAFVHPLAVKKNA